MNSNTPPINQRDVLPVDYELHWYKLCSVIGRGGYGITYLAIDQNLDRKVAIKEYLPIDFAQRQSNDTVHPMTDGHRDLFDWGLKRFLVEARTLARFNHPSIIKVLSVFEHNNTAYMVMDYEEGSDLASIYKQRKSFSEEELLQLFLPIIKGLADVHETGFIHRDVKPSNIYVRENGSAVLLDFGSARQTLGTRTRALTSLVTAGYAPFEQYNESEEQQGPWTDIYGLGATMYYCITGKKPVDALERGSNLLKSGDDVYVPLDPSQYPEYSTAFLHAIDCALKFHPEERPQNARDWADMLSGNTDVIAAAKNEEESLTTEEVPLEERTVILSTPSLHSAAKSSVQATKVSNIDSEKDEPDSSPDVIKNKSSDPHNAAIKLAENVNKAPANITLTNEKESPPDVLEVLSSSAKANDQKTTARPVQQSSAQNDQHLNVKQLLTKFNSDNWSKSFSKTAKYLQDNKIPSSIAAAIVVIASGVAAFSLSDSEEKPSTSPEPTTVAVETPVQRTPAQQIEVAKQEMIAGLLTQARINIANQRYFEPDSNNAVYQYKKILELKNDHPAAINGLNEIAEQFVEKIESNIASENWKQAQQDLDTLRTLPVKIAKIDELQTQLSQYQKQQKQLKLYLAKADNFYKHNRLTVPKNNNALFYYQKVIEIDPQNQSALEGLKNIVSELSVVLNTQIEANKIQSAEKTFNLIESIDSNAPVLSTAESRLGEIYDTRKKVRRLLAAAHKDFINGRVVKPKGNNALSKYRQALKLSPNSKKASEGIELVYQYYAAKLQQYVNEEKFDNAEGILKDVRELGFDRKRVTALRNTIDQEKLAIKNEPKTISKLLAKLETVLEKRDAGAITNMSVFKTKKPQYINTLFKKYSDISVTVRQQSHNIRKHEAYALIKLTGTVNDDVEYNTNSKLDIDIVVQKGADKKWKVIW